MERTGNEKMSARELVIPVAAGTVIQEATMVALNASGYAVPASKSEGLTVVGCATKYVDNALGVNGAEKATVKRGAFIWNNDGSIQETDIMKDAYVDDECTVTITSDGSSKAGKILAVDADGITVEIL